MPKKAFQNKFNSRYNLEFLRTLKRSWSPILWLILVCGVYFSCQEKSSKPGDNHHQLKPELSGVYYLIRHAEKDRTNPENQDPELTQAGLERAKLWQSYFDSIPLTGIYSTGYKRTLQTVIPTAAAKSLNPIIYEPLALLDDNFYKKSSGGHWLIVGHSNTIPILTNTLMNIDTLDDIPDTLNSRLYRVDYTVKPAQLNLLRIE
jgi:2,3-bisphosphoglycerate-dependent phosphoglycerate mutase